MPAILSALAWLFGRLKLGELAGFVLKKIVFSKVIAIEIAMFALMVVYFGALVYISTFLFGQLFDIFDYLKNLTNSNSNNTVTSAALSVISTLGIFKAFWDVFNLYAPMFISMFLIIGSKIGITLLKNLRKSLNELTYYIT